MPRSFNRSSRRSRNTSPRAFAISRIPIVSPSSLSGRGSRGLIVGLRSAVGSRSTVICTSSAGAVQRLRAAQPRVKRRRISRTSRGYFGLILPEPLRRDVVAARRRLLQPFPRFRQVLRYHEPVHIERTDRPLGNREVLLGGLAIPAHRFGIVLSEAPAVFTHDAEIQLRSRQALVCGSAIPAHGLLIILPDAAAFFVHDADVELGERVPLRRRPAIPAHRLREVLPDAAPVFIENADLVLRTIETLVGRHAIPAHRLGIVLRDAMAVLVQ